jgi:hypothetical protein
LSYSTALMDGLALMLMAADWSGWWFAEGWGDCQAVP